MRSGTPIDIVQMCRRAISARTARLIPPLALIVLTSLPAAALAQAVYGSIGGSVKDPTGGVLPGVTVTITSVERKTADTAITNESGNFVKERLLPGTYEVKAELAGFKTAVVPAITVGVDAQTPVTFTLAIGAVSEEVMVTGGSPLLKVDRADVSTRFDNKQLTDLPVLDRNFTKFILLTPGTQQLVWQHAASENPQGSTQTMVNGQHFSGTGYQLDGTENRDPILGIIVINPTLESIGETKITSQNYDAEFGQATAGVVSVQTKSGTNNLHGSAFEFYQTDKFQARNPFTQFQARSAHRTIRPGDRAEPVRRLDRRADQAKPVVLLRRLSGDAQHPGGLEAVDRADRGGAQRQPERVRREHLRSGDGRSSSPATSFRRGGCRRRRRRCWP